MQLFLCRFKLETETSDTAFSVNAVTESIHQL